MDNQTIISTIEEIFIDTFDDDSFQISPDIGRNDILSWNSLGHIRLLTAIEEEFNIEFTIDEISEIGNVGQLTKIIDKKVNS